MYIKVKNNGQHNNGILINKIERKLIKCETTNYELIEVVKNLSNFFPKIYNYGVNWVEMEMYDCDISTFLLKKIPKFIACKTF